MLGIGDKRWLSNCLVFIIWWDYVLVEIYKVLRNGKGWICLS